MNKCAHVRKPTTPEVNVWSTTIASDTWPSRYLALPIPCSRLNARNAPGGRPYCNHQLLKISRIEQNRENLTMQKFFTRTIFNVQIS